MFTYANIGTHIGIYRTHLQYCFWARLSNVPMSPPSPAWAVGRARTTIKVWSPLVSFGLPLAPPVLPPTPRSAPRAPGHRRQRRTPPPLLNGHDKRRMLSPHPPQTCAASWLRWFAPWLYAPPTRAYRKAGRPPAPVATPLGQPWGSARDQTPYPSSPLSLVPHPLPPLSPHPRSPTCPRDPGPSPGGMPPPPPPKAPK